MAVNIDFFTGYAKGSKNECAWWGGSKRRERGREHARKLMKQWGLGYGENGEETIPYSFVRRQDSPQYVPCEDLENIVLQSTNKYDEAYEKHKACGGLAKKCKCREVIDMAKWAYIRDWAEGAVISQSELYGYNTCVEEATQAEIDEAEDLAKSLLIDDEIQAFNAISNTALAGFVGGIGLITTLVLLRASK